MPWDRDAVAYCSCSALQYVHMHCPCQNCNSKAVARSTELQLCKAVKLISNCSTHAHVEDTSNNDMEGTNDDNMEGINDSGMEGINDSGTTGLVGDTQSTFSESHPSNDLSSSAESQTDNPSTDLQKDILIAVLRTFEFMEETNASQKSFMNILNFGRDMYCIGDQNMIKEWPNSWSGCLALLRNNGYKEAVTHYICLNAIHPNQWSILDNFTNVCKFCNQPGTIRYHYISLTNRIQQWCSNESFCQQMMAYWQKKDHWLHQHSEDTHTFNEIWDGQRFCELKWFWDPQEKWLLPVRCPHSTEVISTEVIKSIMGGRGERETEITSTVLIKCPECYTLFDHSPKVHMWRST